MSKSSPLIGVLVVLWLLAGNSWSQEGNYALGRPIISSAQVVPGNPVENLTDGDKRTFTHPNSTSGTNGFYYLIDLGRVRTLDRVVLWNRVGCCPERLRRYRVTLLADGGSVPGDVNWSADMRMDGTYSPAGGSDTVSTAVGSGTFFGGRYIKIENRSGEGNNPQLAEVEAWPAPVPVIRRFETDAGNLSATGQPGRPTSAVLTWQVDNFTSLTLTPQPGPLSEAAGSVSVTPAATTTYTLTATNAAGSTTATLTLGVDEPELPPFISEFMASPNGDLQDEEGDSEDWIEIANPNPFAVNLAGHHLTDDPARPTQWVFPSFTIPAQGQRVVFASGKDRRAPGDPPHTNFSLRAEGEFLALVRPDGTTVLSQFPATFPEPATYPCQSHGRSYGLDPLGEIKYFSPATPEAPNGSGFVGVVEDTKFSVNRGVFTAPQTLVLTTITPGAVIRYTLDGKPPTATTGQVYESPLTIDTTRVVRAAAFLDGFAPTNIDTHTYIFPEKVKTSSVMRTSITNHATHGPQVVPALTDLPSFSMVTPLTIPNGIDVPASLEFIPPPNGAEPGFQEDCGVERFGGDYTDFAKKSFRFHFRSAYGNGRLEYPLFQGFERGIMPARRFDSIELRNGSHDMVDRGFYLSNPFTDAVMLDMGQLNPHGRWVHLYNNGTYWGVYHLRERWDAEMLSDYLGGEPEDYEAVNGNLNVGGWAEPGDPYDGDGSSWTRIKSLRGNYAQVRSYLDVPSYVDFMLTFMFGDSENEYRCAGPKGVGSGFKWFLNDADGWLRNSAGNNTVRSAPGRQAGDGPGSVFSMLYREGNPDYRMLLADRIQKHMLNGGALTRERNVARLNELANAMQRPFIAESARWNYRTPESWTSSKNAILNSWFTSRTNAVLNQYRTAGFFPSLAAPVFSQRGGTLAAGTRITLTGTVGTMYYTTDGSDPRLPGGALSPTAKPISTGVITEPMVPAGALWKWYSDYAGLGASDVVAGHASYGPANWKHPEFDDSTWSEGRAELGYGEGDEATALPFGDPGDRFRTAYFRHAFTLPADSAVSAITLRLKRDDGAVVYLNGAERARDGLTGVVSGDTLALDNAGDDGKTFLSFTLPATALVPGRNVLAVELHQAAPTSGDASFDAELIVTRTTGADAGVPIERNTWLRTRTQNAAQWSALDEAFFQVGPAPIAPGQVVISELHFNPAGTGAEEFLELQNVSDQAVNLRGCRFTEGIDFVFPDNRDTLLAPGQRLVLVEDVFAFQRKYGLEIPVTGRYFGSLANQGETIALAATGGTELLRVTYDDAAPWPAASDGGGYSMVRRPPAANLNSPESWWPSATAGGSPGGSDAVAFSGDPAADRDGDGHSALVEHALGTSDANPADADASIQVTAPAQGTLLVSLRRSLRAEDAQCAFELSPDLQTWGLPPNPPSLVSQVRHPDHTTTETWHIPLAPATSSAFIRVGVSLAAP